MNATTPRDDTQDRLWNGTAGQAWTDLQALIDRLLLPFQRHLVETVGATTARDVLDIGCGTGAVTRAIAQQFGDAGRCTGIDISAPMIALARQLSGKGNGTTDFICADAQHYGFEPQRYDAAVSRFGIMFFEDPASAFANLRASLRGGALLHGVAWRDSADNPFMTAAERAAAPLLPQLPPRRADGPGQFAFADPRRIRRFLADSGWSAIAIEPLDLPCRLSVADLDDYVARMGPVGVALADADDATRERVGTTVRRAFDEFVDAGEARFTAACWAITARA